MKRLTLIAALIAMCAPGCRGRIPEGVFACDVSADCPAGFVCGGSPGRCILPPDGEVPRVDASVDANVAPGDAGTDAAPTCAPATDQLDVLLVIDNSNSMAEEQASLIAALPIFVEALATGDIDRDGTPDTAPFASVHLGIVTTDMGAPTGTPTCSSTSGGDGIFRTTPGSPAGCDATYPAIFQFNPLTETPISFANSVACVARTGTGGCGFEQPLEAALKALSPAATTGYTASDFIAPSFFGGVPGHGEGANAGFLRDDSVLAIVMLTDEEDCSTQDPDLFNPSSITYSGDLNLRCFENPTVVHTVARYSAGFLQLRRDRSRLVFAAITGIPVDAQGLSYTAMLAHPMMAEMPDPIMTRLRPSCTTSRGLAFPPRRIVRVAQSVTMAGAHSTVQSICQDDFNAGSAAILGEIADARAEICPPR